MDPIWIKNFLPATAYLCVAAAAGTAAAILYRKLPADNRWFPLPRLLQGRWTGIDLIVIYLMLAIAQVMVATVLKRFSFFEWYYGQDPSALRKSLWVAPFFLFAFLVFTFAALRSVSGTYPADLGLSRSRWRNNLMLGSFAFVLATPVILSLNTLLSMVSEVVTEHSFEKLLRDGLDPAEWCLLFFSATVMAPIVEEVLFRGLILGWLRRATLAGHVTLAVITLVVSVHHSIDVNKAIMQARDAEGRPMLPAPEDLANSIEAVNWSRIGVTIGFGLLYAAWLWRLQKQKLFLSEADFASELNEAEVTDPEHDGAMPSAMAAGPANQPATTAGPAADWPTQDCRQQFRKGWLAIFGSAFFFAFNHDTWPGPIPLLLLGLVLGRLTQRSQNLLPAIVVHSLFNLVATLILLLTQVFGQS